MTVLASRGQLRASFLRWSLLIVSTVLLAGFFAHVLGGGGPGNPWFNALHKPTLTPPSETYRIVWAILYLMMGVALTMVVTARGAPGRGLAIAAFLIQLGLNLAWPLLFFAAHRITAALYLLVALDLAVLVTAALFWRVRRAAALLLLPYLGWVLFATLLNREFLVANPDADAANPDADGRTAAATRFEI